ncbi:nucleoside-diphosphate sugar epimerase/dehydratase [Uliginosibacterium sp. H3]|uniref:Nucleoside-diphosphate sugar epimerase/dehydratase n=1 Tax=Uliginosibacterium silvisoli TaxID=3114758 RepID=A0ABU6K0Z7_9RHOO|nr:nucleoside-diphosphate sugar epimerase/dehydratase [Uliginosibacterium sp. H3]
MSCFDLVAVAACWCGAYLLRFNFSVPPDFMRTGLFNLAWILPVHAFMFRGFGLYKGMWVFASLPDLSRIVKAVGTAAIVVIVVAGFVRASVPIPRSVLVAFPVFLLVVMGGARAMYRAWREYYLYGALAAAGRPALLIGAGEAGVSVMRQLQRSPEWRLVGVLDDNPGKHGREMMGLRIHGSIDELEHWARELKAQHAIVAMPSASAEVRKRILGKCLKAGVHALMVPTLAEMMSSDRRLGGDTQTFREVNMEDLLGRDPVAIDCPNIDSMLGGRTVLVTGAGGSIGSELCRQIALFHPGQIIAYEANEYALYRLVEEFGRRFPEVPLVPVAGDVRDALWLDETFARHTPALVFHAAAYKHVPLMEDDNAWQAITNNVLGTWRVAKAAATHRVPKFVMISTDKAVNPTNVMGASKRLAEMVCQVVQGESPATAFCSVRFGNVLGSAGSVVPKFQEQIAAGGPVTVTHPEITRYFMSIPEASQLVLQAASMGTGGEIFVLDMGEPVKIANLARDMIRLSGAENIQVEFTGLRPGEKLYEELLADTEHSLPTHHEKLRMAQARAGDPQVVAEIIDWLRASRVPSPTEIKRELRRWVPEYAPFQRPLLQPVPNTGPVESSRAIGS